MMHLKLMPPEGFLESETRNEYLVDEKRKKIWAVEIDLLSELDRVCRENNIEYFIFAGTLLGAVRHGGFIPWDDDIDVAMTRESYNKFIGVSDSFSEPYFLQTALTDRKYVCTYARLRNSNTTGMLAWTRSPEYNNGIYIDIHPLDGYVGDCLRLRVQFFKKKFVRFLMNTYYSEAKLTSSFPKRIVYSITKGILNKYVPFEKLYELYVRIVGKYNGSASSIGMFDANTIEELKRYNCKKEDLIELVNAKFEYIMIKMPQKASNILNNLYGDYMRLPPLDKVKEWHGDMIFFDPDKPYKEYFK